MVDHYWYWLAQVVLGKIPPFPFGRIYFMVLVMRKGGESS